MRETLRPIISRVCAVILIAILVIQIIPLNEFSESLEEKSDINFVISQDCSASQTTDPSAPITPNVETTACAASLLQ